MGLAVTPKKETVNLFKKLNLVQKYQPLTQVIAFTFCWMEGISSNHLSVTHCRCPRFRLPIILYPVLAGTR